MKNATLVYKDCNGTYNLGDYIQSLAAMQYFKKIDHYINREKLAEYTSEPAKIILNGWYTHEPNNWVPSEKLIPLMTSMHINSNAAKAMLSSDGIAYLQNHAPIGCRDYYTKDLLEKNGIEAFFSGCLTLTLDTYKVKDEDRTDNIYIVDPLFNSPSPGEMFSSFKKFRRYIKKGDVLKIFDTKKILSRIFQDSILDKCIPISHNLPSEGVSHDTRFQIAEETLRKYAKAKLVITSRIHCALPCLALGTPVIFLDSFNEHFDSCRFGGITDLFNTIKIDKSKKLNSNFIDLSERKIGLSQSIKNPDEYIKYATELRKQCDEFVSS